MADILLHDYWRSSAAYRVRIALNLKGVDYQRRSVNLAEGEQKQPGYRKINPQGLVPCLEIDGLRLCQSLAIVEYLDSTRPEPRLIPIDAAERAHVMAMALIIACDIHPLNNLRVVRYLDDPLGLSKEQRDGWYTHWIVEGFRALERLARPHAGEWLFGDTPTIADICLIPQMFNATRFAVPVKEFELLRAIDDRAAHHPAFAAAHPERVLKAEARI